jgi:hypothetical protein
MKTRSEIVPCLHIPVPSGFEVCWAGPSPLPQAKLCFGSVDGRLLFTNEDGAAVADPVKMRLFR